MSRTTSGANVHGDDYRYWQTQVLYSHQSLHMLLVFKSFERIFKLDNLHASFWKVQVFMTSNWFEYLSKPLSAFGE